MRRWFRGFSIDTGNIGIKVPVVALADRQIEVDEEGFITHLDDWSVEVAEAMAQADGLILANDHWQIINFLREYYQTYQIAPAIRILTKAVGRTMGKDKGNSRYLYKLFPYGPAKQGCRYAGLPKPTGCI